MKKILFTLTFGLIALLSYSQGTLADGGSTITWTFGGESVSWDKAALEIRMYNDYFWFVSGKDDRYRITYSTVATPSTANIAALNTILQAWLSTYSYGGLSADSISTDIFYENDSSYITFRDPVLFLDSIAISDNGADSINIYDNGSVAHIKADNNLHLTSDSVVINGGARITGGTKLQGDLTGKAVTFTDILTTNDTIIVTDNSGADSLFIQEEGDTALIKSTANPLLINASNFEVKELFWTKKYGKDNLMIGERSGESVVSDAAQRNTGIGARALQDLTIGDDNTVLGRYAGTNIVDGLNNVAIGSNALSNNIAGDNNVFIGYQTGNNGGNDINNNVAVGFQALYDVTGAGNVAIGRRAGYNITSGENSIFLGYEAGFNETNSNRLYIENSSSATPLIYGEFDTDYIVHNTDSTRITGNLIVDGVRHVENCEEVADDGTIALPDATAGLVEIWVNDGTQNELIIGRTYTDGSVTLVTTNGSTAGTDSDTNLCLFDSGTGSTIKNRLGASYKVCYTFKTAR